MQNNKSRKALCIALAAITALTMNLGCAAEVFAEDTEETANVAVKTDETTPATGDTEEDTDNGETGGENATEDSTPADNGEQVKTEDTPMLLAAEEDAAQGISIDDKNFPDPVFMQYISGNFDKDGDGFLSAEEIAAATEINLDESAVASLEGIQYLTALTTLSCAETLITSIDVSSNTALINLDCFGNHLTTLDISSNTALEYLECGDNEISVLDVSNNKVLVELYCYSNNIGSLDLSSNTLLTALDCADNNLAALDVSRQTALEELNCEENQLTSLDLSKNTDLGALDCSDNLLTALDVSNNTGLFKLHCYTNQLTALDISKNTDLQWFSCFGNQITSLDMSNNPWLEDIDCSNNKLTVIDLSNNKSLEDINCAYNNLTSLDISKIWVNNYYCVGNTYNIVLKNGTFDLEELPGNFDISKASDWKGVKCENGVLSEFEGIDGENIVTYEYDIGDGEYVTFTLVYFGEGIAVDSTVFPDENFRKYILDNIDTDKNGALDDNEIAAVTEMNISGLGIADLTGIEYFTELKILEISENEISKADLSQNIKLKYLDCNKNKLMELNVSGCTSLIYFSIRENYIETIDLSSNTQLKCLDCSEAGLFELNVSNNPNLSYLDCSYNHLDELDLSGNTQIKDLDCSGNNLTNIVSNAEFFDCADNAYHLGVISDSFDLSELPGSFDASRASNWQGASCENGKLVNITGDKITYTYDCGNGHAAQFTLYYTKDIGIDNMPINEEYFPDAYFRKYVSDNIDSNRDGVLSEEERFGAEDMYLWGMEIKSIKGIEYFPNLELLMIIGNDIREADLSKNNMIYVLSYRGNNTSKLILGNMPNLTSLDCSENKFTSIDVSGIKGLTLLNVSGNKLKNIDISALIGLNTLYASRNELTSIDISDNRYLSTLHIDGNCLTSLDLPDEVKDDISVKSEKNIYNITLDNGTYSLANLPGKFDISKASDWQGAECKNGVLKNITGIPSDKDGVRYITYKYDIGLASPVTFTLAYTTDKTEDKPETPAAPTNNYPTPVLPANGVSYEGSAYTADGTVKGWVSIEKAVKNAKKGAVITINMNNNEVVSKRIFKRAMGKDITLVFNSGIYTWTVNGKDITTPKNVHFCAHTADEKLSGKALYDRSYGFTATLTVSLDGKYASLFHYHTSADELKYTDSCKIKDGKAEFTVDRSANYVIVTGEKPVKEFTAE